MLMLKCKHHSSNINYPSALERLGMDRGVNPNSTIYNIRVLIYRSNNLGDFEQEHGINISASIILNTCVHNNNNIYHVHLFNPCQA